MLKLYRYREHTKGYWSLGIAKGRSSITLELGKWTFMIYKDDFR